MTKSLHLGTARFLLVCSLLSVAMLAADFWGSKKPSDWSEKEAQKLLESSPWAKSVEPKFNMEGMRTGMPGGGRGMGGGGGMRGGGGMG